MLSEQNIWALAESYAAGTLSAPEAAALRNKLATDPQFASEFNESLNLVRSMNDAGKQMRFKAMLTDISKANKTTVQPTRAIPLRTYYWRTAAIAAGMALLTSLTTYWAIQHSNKKMASEYRLLRRDLEKYRHSQNQLINNLKEQQNPRPEAEVRYTGTGFALSNDGYLVTNYHVVEGADSVYIQNIEGHYFKANIVAADHDADVAILKVDNKGFRFGKSEVPYTLASGKQKLGTRIYTLGFPQDNVVYNEGYISSKNGYNGDSLQYQLEVPAYAGQSGAPILDANGNVLAMITGKESNSEGTTYAVSAKALTQLIRTLPKDAGLRMPKTNKLAKLQLQQQIEKLEYYTCSIKVYKK